MKVRAVIDLMGGVVVRGVRGQRDLYRPIESKLTSSTAPRDIALAIHEATGINDFYIADLDAIQKGTPPDWRLACWIAENQWTLWMDPGIRIFSDLNDWQWDVAIPVIGTETFADFPVEKSFHKEPKPILSMDSMNGILLGKGGCQFDDAQSLWKSWESIGIRDLILMDLARVGSYLGPLGGIENPGPAITFLFPGARFHAAGGVRDEGDLKDLEKAGFSSALVASAIHDGGLGRRN